jgi:hypothetical protein
MPTAVFEREVQTYTPATDVRVLRPGEETEI